MRGDEALERGEPDEVLKRGEIGEALEGGNPDEVSEKEEKVIDDEKFIEGIWGRIEERERNLKILEGLERKHESDMLPMVREFLGRMGIRGLFYGIADVVALSMMMCVCACICIFIYLRQAPQSAHGILFIFAPMLYTCIFCLAYVKETQINTISVQMSCRYTFFHVLAVRMLLNSGLAIVFNLIYICAINRFIGIGLVKPLALSFSSLMLFSVMLLKALRRRDKIWGFVGTTAIWLGVNIAAFRGAGPLYMSFIERVPLGVLAISGFLAGAVYCRELKKMIDRDGRSSLVKYQ